MGWDQSHWMGDLWEGCPALGKRASGPCRDLGFFGLVTAHVCFLPPQPHSRDHLPARSPSSNATPEVPGAWRWCPQCRLDSLPRLNSWPRHRPVSGAGMTWLLQSEPLPPPTPPPPHAVCTKGREGPCVLTTPCKRQDSDRAQQRDTARPQTLHQGHGSKPSPSHMGSLGATAGCHGPLCRVSARQGGIWGTWDQRGRAAQTNCTREDSRS